jgi:hypothetical protein
LRDFVVVLLLPAAIGCGEKPLERRDLPPKEVFIAMESDFQGFRAWGSVSLGGHDAEGVTHPAGQRHAYVNAFPEQETREFPVGTMVVQQSRPDGEGESRIFAMVKRGAGFNPRAPGWEWFELKERPDGSAGVAWRGLGPPVGEEYGGDPSGTCNSCHRRARENDFVQSAALKL